MANEQENEGESLSVKKNKQKSDLLHLWVNLKIPKQEQQEEEERGTDIIIEDDQTIGCKNNTAARVCGICQATFGSGKALGGHMRVHFRRAAAHKKQNPKLQPATTTTFKKEKKKKIAPDQNQKLPVKKPTCSLCGRGFLSMKSLFGHMRSHPNREWRGIHPPSNASSVDLTGSLSGWAVTARRGRQAAGTASSSEVSTSDEDHQLHQAAACLMMLSRSGEKPETAKNHVFGKEEVEEEEARTKKKRKKVKLCDLAPPLMDDDDKKKVAVAAAAVVVVDKYKCSSCERSFTTHQALGGHMSSHNRSNHNNNINLIINNNNNIFMLAKNEDLVCNDYPYPQVVVEETTNKGGGLSSNVVMEFDLNEAPPPSDDGEFCSSW